MSISNPDNEQPEAPLTTEGTRGLQEELKTLFMQLKIMRGIDWATLADPDKVEQEEDQLIQEALEKTLELLRKAGGEKGLDILDTLMLAYGGDEVAGILDRYAWREIATAMTEQGKERKTADTKALQEALEEMHNLLFTLQQKREKVVAKILLLTLEGFDSQRKDYTATIQKFPQDRWNIYQQIALVVGEKLLPGVQTLFEETGGQTAGNIWDKVIENLSEKQSQETKARCPKPFSMESFSEEEDRVRMDLLEMFLWREVIRNTKNGNTPKSSPTEGISDTVRAEIKKGTKQ